MIAHVRGEVAEKLANAVIIDVAGVGYEVQVSLVDYETVQLGETVKLYTYHHTIEQVEDLFGFGSIAAKKLFELLITVQGIGPKAGLAILGLGNSEDVRNAIANSDSAFISQASGVGKKTAERVVVDLADKVGLPTLYKQTGQVRTEFNTSDEALEALMALGYTLADATKALEHVDSSLPTNQRITQALKE